jgi:hypothetical protein
MDHRGDIDWIEWTFFLEFLSVERFEKFLDELDPPFQRHSFKEVSRHARACLEVHIAPLVPPAGNDTEFRTLPFAWSRYRTAEGVLSDDDLRTLLNKYKRPHNASLAIFVELKESFSYPDGDNLIKWFLEDFRSAPDPIWIWPWALDVFFGELQKTLKLSAEAPVSASEREILRDFCIRYREKRRQLREHFRTIYIMATANPPTAWETVLRAHGGGIREDKHPWLENVERCLELKLDRSEWTHLRNIFGNSALKNVTSWIKSQEALLPVGSTLPPEPN